MKKEMIKDLVNLNGYLAVRVDFVIKIWQEWVMVVKMLTWDLCKTPFFVRLNF